MAALMWFAGVLLFGYSCCCYLPYRYLVGFEWPRLRQLLYFPLAGQLRWEHATQRALLLRRLGAEEVSLTTSDERAVHAVWAEPQGQNAGGGGGGNNGEGARPVVLLLHANAMVLDDMTDWAQYYLSLGCAVLVLTFWGYPDPAEEHAAYSERPDAPGSPDAREAGALLPGEAAYCPSELSLYLDAEAALSHIRTARGAPVERVLVHGLSIGGGAACALGVRHPGLRVTLDQTFASMHAVSAHVGKGLYEQVVLSKAPRWSRSFLRAIAPCAVWLAAWLVVALAFRPPSAAERHAPHCAVLDRLDNVGKAGRMRGDLFVFFAEQSMPRRRAVSPSSPRAHPRSSETRHDEMMPHHFAERLLAARYGRSQPELLQARSLCVPGGHCSFFGDVPELRARYKAYLNQSGFLP